MKVFMHLDEKDVPEPEGFSRLKTAGLAAVYMICACLFSSSLTQTANYDQAFLNEAATPVDSAGTLSYLPGFKRPSSSSPGTFIYIKLQPAFGGTTTIRFFDSAKTSTYYHDYTVSVPVSGLVHKAVMLKPSENKVAFNLTTLDKQYCRTSFTFTYDAGVLQWKRQGSANDDVYCGMGGYSSPFLSDDKLHRMYINLPSDSSNAFFLFSDSPGGPQKQAGLSWSAQVDGQPRIEFIDHAIDLGSAIMYINRNGRVSWDTSTEIETDMEGSSQSMPDFMPKYATVDRSRDCASPLCYIVVLEERTANSMRLTMMRVSYVPAFFANFEYFSSDLSAIATSNMPIIIPKIKTVILLGPTRFYLVNFYLDRFEVGDMDSVTMPTVPSNSLVLGEFNQALYQDEIPVMMLVPSGASFQPRMYVIKTTRCLTRDAGGVCTTCNIGYVLNAKKGCDACDVEGCAAFADGCVCTTCKAGYRKNGGGLCEACTTANCKVCNADKSVCEECKAGNIFYMSKCTTCGTTAPAAIFAGAGSPTCVSTSPPGSTYSEGYRRDTAVTAFVLIEACTVTNCKTCAASAATCTECKTGDLLHSGQCTTCGSIAPAALVVEKGTPKCVSTDPGVSATYTTGYRRDTTITDFVFLEKCTVADCAACTTNAATCSECSSGKVLHLNTCITCAAVAPAAIVVELGVPKCVDTSSGTYSTGHRRVTSVTSFVLIEACTTDCATCPASADVCTLCKPGKILYLGKCLACGSAPPAAVVVEAGLPKCVDTSSGSYAEGYRRDSRVTDFVLIEACLEGCKTCPVISTTCTECKTGRINYLNKCTTCGTVAPAAMIVESTGPKCVDTSAGGLYAEGYRRDSSVTNFVLLEPCSVTNCKTCAENKATCTACKSGNIFYLNLCTTCGSTLPAAIVIEAAKPKCISTAVAPYNEGYGQDLHKTNFTLIQPCSDSNCRNCTASFQNCTACKSRFTLTESICKQSASSDPRISKVFASLAKNSYGFVLLPNQSRSIHTVVVRDTETGTSYTCAEVGCSSVWKESLLTIKFESPITITKAEITIKRKPDKTTGSKAGRRLQVDETDLTIGDITITKITNTAGWVTAIQVLLFVFRMVVSPILFKKYPHMATVPDRYITTCFMLCMFLGPLIYISDSALEMIGQIKILWFRVDNLAEGWDTKTLGISPAPNTWKFPTLASFLDNYSQNMVGFLALTVILAIAQFTATKLLQKQTGGHFWTRIFRILADHFTAQYVFSKLDANSLEILMYCLICFDKADASSKSIIGIMLAVLLLATQVWLASGAIVDIFYGTDTKGKYEQPKQEGSTALTTVYDMSAPQTSKPSSNNNYSNRRVFELLTAGYKFLPKTNTTEVSVSKRFLVPVQFLRNLILCILALKLLSSPVAQLVLAAVFQALYVGYYSYCRIHSVKIEFWTMLSVEVSMLLILILKIISTSESLSDSGLQHALGSLILAAMALFVLTIFGILGFGLYTLFGTTKPAAETPTKREKATIQVLESEEVSNKPIQTEVGVKHLREEQPEEYSIPEENMDPLSSEKLVPVMGRPSAIPTLTSS